MTPAERHMKLKQWMYKCTYKGQTNYCWEYEKKGRFFAENIHKANSMMSLLPPWVRCTVAEVHSVIQKQRSQGVEAYDGTLTHKRIQPGKAA